jgi:hypothetical protein
MGARGEDHVRRKRDQLGRIFADVILFARGPSVVDLDIGPIGPTQLLQPTNASKRACTCGSLAA